jgi:hypothetical protein
MVAHQAMTTMLMRGEVTLPRRGSVKRAKCLAMREERSQDMKGKT